MFYVSRRLDDTHFGVIDTEDGKEDIFTASELRKLDDTYEINGVGNEGICPVRTPNEVLSILRSNDLHLAISVMPFYEEFGIKIKSKPTGGEMTFVHHQCVNLWRTDVNSFRLDNGTSKSSRSGLTIDDVLIYFSQYQGWTIESVQRGRY